jgi:citrate lyase beta subunit
VSQELYGRQIVWGTAVSSRGANARHGRPCFTFGRCCGCQREGQHPMPDTGPSGSPCVHLDRVRILHEQVSPTDDELSRARRIIGASQESSGTPTGTITVDGRMVDSPVRRGARGFPSRRKAIQKWPWTHCRDPTLGAG